MTAYGRLDDCGVPAAIIRVGCTRRALPGVVAKPALSRTRNNGLLVTEIEIFF
jgi:hypothetical protein